jgi:type I restriction enzyme R subunit
MNKKDLSERDICSKFIGPAIKRAGWDGMIQIREEVAFTKGRIIVRGKLVTRGKAKRADYILYYKPNIPIAIIEAKDNNHSVGDGMQQALDYAATLNIHARYFAPDADSQDESEVVMGPIFVSRRFSSSVP